MSRPPVEKLRKRVHVGCGPNALKSDWWNVDIRPFAGVDQVCDITHAWHDLSAVDYVYGEHFLEHLSLEQAFSFLQNAWHAMADGGRIRLSTPSLEWVMATHFDLTAGDEAILRQTFSINRAFHGWGHRFLWSKPMLTEALTACGFRAVTFFGYGESEDFTFQDIEEHGNYSVDRGFPSVWIVEAERSGSALKNEVFFATAAREFIRHVESGH